MEQIFSILPIGICECIAGLTLPLNLGFYDTVAWLGSNDGNFSIHFTYNHIFDHVCALADHCLQLIWKWKGVERIKVFLW